MLCLSINALCQENTTAERIAPPTAPPTAPTLAPEDVPLEDVAPGEVSGTRESTPQQSPHNQVTPPTTSEVEVKASSIAAGEETGSFDFMRQALYAGILVALMCSYLGVYVVLKRIVFVGVALSEMSSAGIALMIFLARYSTTLAPTLRMPQEQVDHWFANDAPLIGAILFMLLGVALFSIHWSPRRVPHESYIGVLYSIAGAIAILLIAQSAQGEGHMLTLLQGDVLTVTQQQIQQALGVFVIVALIHFLFGKEFLLVSFDRESASTLGFRAAAWDLLLFLTIGIVISFSIRLVGVLMASSMLILPASTALLLTNRLKHAMLLAPLLGASVVFVGLRLPAAQDLPSSAVIVGLSFLLLLPALAFNALKQRA